jgi:hypothetical protein
MVQYVVFRDHDGWFKVAHDYWFDDPTYKLDGQRVDTREEVTRYADLIEAMELRTTYNMMVHGEPPSR